jgi:hypothetical protein
MDLKMFRFYQKFLFLLGILLLSIINASVVWSNSNIYLVEIKLLNNLDDERGFCIDIKGHKSRAKVNRGLQAHTCYSYQGEIAIDQGLEANRFKQKELFFSNFNVCVNLSSYNNPLRLNLTKCQNSEKFIFYKDDTIRLKDNTNLCLTVAKDESRKGGGGSPLHLIRNLSMETCNKEDSVYQNWVIRYVKEGQLFEEKISKF